MRTKTLEEVEVAGRRRESRLVRLAGERLNVWRLGIGRDTSDGEREVEHV